MRVIAGAFKGRRLRAPRSDLARPTYDRVREAVFSMLGTLEGVRVLDLFAGSGALGIEALSRGAVEAVFVDRDPRALAAVRANLAALGLEAPVVNRDAIDYLAAAPSGVGPGGSLERFDLVFLDPPYSSAVRLAGPLSERLPAVLDPRARIVSESDKHAPLELRLPLETERVFGDTRIAIHRAR